MALDKRIGVADFGHNSCSIYGVAAAVTEVFDWWNEPHISVQVNSQLTHLQLFSGTCYRPWNRKTVRRISQVSMHSVCGAMTVYQGRRQELESGGTGKNWRGTFPSIPSLPLSSSFPFLSLPFFPFPSPLPLPFPFPFFSEGPPNTARRSGGALWAPPAGMGGARPPNAFWCILVQKSSHLSCLSLQYFGVSLY